MKRLFIVLCLAGLAAACTNRQNTDATTSADAARIDSATQSTAAVPLTTRLTSLGLTSDHDWRKVSLGDDFTAAKATETTQPFEQDAGHVGYSQEFDNLESVDYQYFQAGNKVTGIQVDLYLNNAGSVKSYQQELVAYLNARYGAGTASAKTMSWKNGNVVLKDVSKGKDFGLKLEMK